MHRKTKEPVFLLSNGYPISQWQQVILIYFLLPVKLITDLSGVFNNALSLMSNKEVTVKLQGSVKAGKGVLVRIPISYEGKKKLNVF